MRVLLVISLLFSFVEVGFVDLAHAGDHDHPCIENLNDDNTASSCQQDDHDHNCDHCCCGHTHSTANVSTLSISSPPNLKQHTISHLSDHHASTYLSDLFRPPRF